MITRFKYRRVERNAKAESQATRRWAREEKSEENSYIPLIALVPRSNQLLSFHDSFERFCEFPRQRKDREIFARHCASFYSEFVSCLQLHRTISIFRGIYTFCLQIRYVAGRKQVCEAKLHLYDLNSTFFRTSYWFCVVSVSNDTALILQWIIDVDVAPYYRY